MPKKISLVGDKIGRLKVIEEENVSRNGTFYFCVCDCGKPRITSRSALANAQRNNIKISCGCWKNELSSERLKESNPILKRVHGHRSGTNEVRVESQTWASWRCVKQRCYNPKHDAYPCYGAKGIFMCERWLNSFPNFLQDMGERPKGKTIDRIDNKGNYTCGHCPQCFVSKWTKNAKWSTPKEQARNRSSNRILTVHNFTGCLAEIAERFGVNAATISSRLERGWTIQDAVEKL